MPLAVDHVFICVENPHAAESALTDMLCDLDVLGLRPAAEHHLELDWDGATSGGFHDFRPTAAVVGK
jgi:hypothetical protein